MGQRQPLYDLTAIRKLAVARGLNAGTLSTAAGIPLPPAMRVFSGADRGIVSPPHIAKLAAFFGVEVDALRRKPATAEERAATEARCRLHFTASGAICHYVADGREEIVTLTRDERAKYTARKFP